MYRGNSLVWAKVDLPSMHDVLFAKGRPYQHHAGNQEYLRLIHECLQDYERAINRKEKRAVAWKLIDSMRARSTRFLIKDQDDWWVEASEKEMHEKVIKAFSHASTSSKKRYTLPSVQVQELSMAKRMRIEPRLDLPDGLPCLTQSCFLLQQARTPSVRA